MNERHHRKNRGLHLAGLLALGVLGPLTVQAEPQGGGMPTASWATSQIIEDVYPLTIPPDTPPGAYRVVVGVYNPLDGTHLIDTATGEGEVGLRPAVIVK